ncbi:GSCFA domain-containing protein [Flavobacteriaceae bacterium MHTCC 0001]
MDLQTKIPLKKQSEGIINYNSNILLLGSCFSEHIGKKFSYFKFLNSQNPFGILFHPKAIERLVLNAVNKKTYSEKDVFFQNERWHCFDAHSYLSDISKQDLLYNLNTQIELTNRWLKEATHIIITLGTAWVYKHIITGDIVANCHKIPQTEFKKELLSFDGIYQSLDSIISLISSLNPKAHLIFTVSPVRHLKDGFVENTLSKSHLVSAIHQILSKNNKRKGVTAYFPSYEIVMDELRDYRFYEEDMVHPNQIAINYIWDRFKRVWISDGAFKTMEAVENIQKGLRHKPFNPNSEAHQKFLQNLELKKEALLNQFSHIVF